MRPVVEQENILETDGHRARFTVLTSGLTLTKPLQTVSQLKTGSYGTWFGGSPRIAAGTIRFL